MFSRPILQRYMSGDKALKFITDEGFYFRRIDGYPDDPTEGERECYGPIEQQLTEHMNSSIFKSRIITPEIGQQLSSNLMNQEKQSLFIQSWFWQKQISRYMWEIYGGLNNNPDCALFTVDHLKLGCFLDRELPVGYEFGPIKYVSNKQAQRNAVFTKQDKFKSECEYRISINIQYLIHFNNKILPEFNWLSRTQANVEGNPAQYYNNGGVAREDSFKYVDEYGFILKAPLPTLLEAIYIPTSASVEFGKKLDKLLASKGYVIRCHRIEPKVN